MMLLSVRRMLLVALCLVGSWSTTTMAFTVVSPPSTTSTTKAIRPVSSILLATTQPAKPPRKKYEPKWKKKATVTEQMGAPPSFEQIGIKGDVTVLFKQGNVTKTTLGMRGQPLREVAIQAGQFIKYGCGKGECGTCEALVNGKWIRPCSTSIPIDASSNDPYVVIVKEIKSKKTTSSGKFFSVRSFLMGFWTNVVGMLGFVKSRKLAKKNWEERREYEDLIKQKALEKKLARQQQEQQNPNLKP